MTNSSPLAQSHILRIRPSILHLLKTYFRVVFMSVVWILQRPLQHLFMARHSIRSKLHTQFEYNKNEVYNAKKRNINFSIEIVLNVIKTCNICLNYIKG